MDNMVDFIKSAKENDQAIKLDKETCTSKILHFKLDEESKFNRYIFDWRNHPRYLINLDKLKLEPIKVVYCPLTPNKPLGQKAKIPKTIAVDADDLKRYMLRIPDERKRSEIILPILLRKVSGGDGEDWEYKIMDYS